MLRSETNQFYLRETPFPLRSFDATAFEIPQRENKSAADPINALSESMTLAETTRAESEFGSSTRERPHSFAPEIRTHFQQLQ